MTPPAAKPRQLEVPPVTLVNEYPADVARARVQVLIGAPRGKVDVPVMQRQGHVARRVREVESGNGAGGVRGLGQPLHIEQLTREIIDAAEKDECDLVRMAINRVQDVFFANQSLAIPGRDLDDGVLGIESVEPRLRLQQVTVRREHFRFTDDLVALPGRAVERDEQEVDIGRQRVHADDLRLLGADDPGHRRCQALVVAVPRIRGMKMAFDAVFCPLVEFQLDSAPHGLRLQPQRMAREIYNLGRAQGRKVKTVTTGLQWIGLVLCPGELECRFVLHYAPSALLGERYPAFGNFFARVPGAAIGARARFVIGIERLVERRQIINDGLQQHLDAVHEAAALEAVPFEGVLRAGRSLGLDDQSDAPRHRALRRVSNMWRQHEDLAFANHDVIELALIKDLEHHVAFKLVEELLDRIVMVVGTLVRTADDERHHAGVFPDLLVAYRRLQEMPVLVDPGLKVESSKSRHCLLLLHQITICVVGLSISRATLIAAIADERGLSGSGLPSIWNSKRPNSPSATTS